MGTLEIFCDILTPFTAFPSTLVSGLKSQKKFAWLETHATVRESGQTTQLYKMLQWTWGVEEENE